MYKRLSKLMIKNPLKIDSDEMVLLIDPDTLGSFKIEKFIISGIIQG
jgi:hypothetical protein